MAQAKKGNIVKVHYTGKLTDGTVFDDSLTRQPLEFTIGNNNLIPGFENATFAPLAKFLPRTLSSSWLPLPARAGSTAVTSGVDVVGWAAAAARASEEACAGGGTDGVGASAGREAGASAGAGPPVMVKGASATELAGLLTNKLTVPPSAFFPTATRASSCVALARFVAIACTAGLENETYAPAEKFFPSTITVTSSPAPA